MKRLLFSALGLLAACAVGSGFMPVALAQQNLAPVQYPFSLTAAGQRLPTITFNGPITSCAIVVYNSGGGFTLVPQVSSDALNNPTPTWVTDTNLNSGSISATGSFVGNVSTLGLTAFGGVLSALTSGTITGVVSCSGSLGYGPFVTPAPGSSGYVILYPTPAPAQAGNAGVTGQFLAGLFVVNGAVSTPAPAASATSNGYVWEVPTGSSHPMVFYDAFDAGQALSGSFVAKIQTNNQGSALDLFGFNRSGIESIVGGGSVTSAALPTPAAPAPTCSPGGANGTTTYFVQTNYVSAGNNSINKSASSAEQSVACAVNTFLEQPAPPSVAGARGYTVSAATTTGQEKEQTGGTSPASGVNVPFTAPWIAAASLSGATAATANDQSLSTFTAQDAALSTTYMRLAPEGTSLFTGPLEASTKSQTASATPNPSTFVAPVYTSAGAAVGSTYHGAEFTCTFSSSTTCTSSAWTNAAVFASAVDGCSIKSSSTGVAFTVTTATTTQVSLLAGASNSQTVTGVCWGT